MARSRKTGTRITDAAALKVLAAPLRQELVDSLEARDGQASVAELAHDLGRPADGLYYHLRLLQRAGLLRQVEAAPDDGARRYAVVREGKTPLALDYRPRAPRQREAVDRAIDGMLRIAARDFRAAHAAAGTVLDGETRELWAARGKGWLSTRDLKELNALLRRAAALLRKPRGEGRERLVSLCFVLAPVAAKPMRRGSE